MFKLLYHESVSAACTCTCYFINMMLDVVVLTTGNYRFSSGVEITVDKLTGVVTNCSEDENIYQGQQFDVVIGRSLNILLKINHVFRILHL